ncbi:hypothetical protein FOHLNKBM_5785 [Methylobacterium longum]|uniref:hypothetical protein n=1 Tax=Methylobacterium longum TaxID=767694 RepID=UPI001EE239AB|nr:hypothetical protein [Methylobacterium longum]GJE14710.1 hypothetical protein FOHLNKBM_5785 [Methylobacterium longum]
MRKTTFSLAAATLLGSLALGVGTVSAAPMPVNGLHTGQSGVTQVRMMHGDRMMMKKRMMRRRMMRKRMMNRM